MGLERRGGEGREVRFMNELFESGTGGWSRKTAAEEQCCKGPDSSLCPWVPKSPLHSGIGTLGHPCSSPEALSGL